MSRLRQIAIAFALCAMSMSAGARPFTAKDLASLDRVSSPSISPDGRYVAYALRSTDWDANKGVNSLNVIDLKGDAAKPLVVLSGEKGGASPAWSDDGRWLYIISGKSGSAQLWRANADGSVRQQITAFPVDVAGFRLAPDSRTAIVVAGVYPDCGSLACTKARIDANAKEKGSAIEIKGGEPRWFDSYIDETRLALFRVDLAQPGAPSEASPIAAGFAGELPPDGDTDTLAISPDGRTLYFQSIEPGADRGGQSFSRLYAVPTDGSAPPRVLLASPATSLGSPALSPDGARLAYLSVTATPPGAPACRPSWWSFPTRTTGC